MVGVRSGDKGKGRRKKRQKVESRVKKYGRKAGKQHRKGMVMEKAKTKSKRREIT